MKICKLDISNEFKRVPLRPDYCAIFRHQFDAESRKTGEDIALDCLAIHVGFSASPAIFAMRAEVTQRTHHIAESEDGSWSRWEPSHSEIFAGDAIFVVDGIGNIPTDVVKGWGWCCRGLFGPDIINESKTALEGRWATRFLVLGFDVDAIEGIIAAPVPKIEGARTFAMSEEFVVGSQHIAIAALQTLRGYMQHWLVASMFCASCVQPVDLPMSYSSEDGAAANCPNFQIWSGFWI